MTSMILINHFIQLDEQLSRLLHAIVEQDWDRVESEGAWINSSKRDLELALSQSSAHHPDELLTMKKILANFEKCQTLLSARLLDINSLIGNNAVEIKLARAYGG